MRKVYVDLFPYITKLIYTPFSFILTDEENIKNEDM